MRRHHDPLKAKIDEAVDRIGASLGRLDSA